MRAVLLLQQQSTISCGTIQLIKRILARNFGYRKNEQILKKGDNYLRY